MTHEQLVIGNNINKDINQWKEHKEAIEKRINDHGTSRLKVTSDGWSTGVVLETEDILGQKVNDLVQIYLMGVDKRIKELERQLQEV